MNDQTTTLDKRHLFRDNGVRGTLTLVFLLLALYLFAQTLVTLKEYKYVGGGVPAATTITVSGMGEEFAAPDTTQFTFSVIENAATVSQAQQKATEKMDKALAAVRAAGVEDKNIKTVSYDIHPNYEQVACVRYPCPAPKANGFEVTQTQEIKMKDSQKAGELLSTLAGLEVQNISGLSFTIEDEDAVRAQARAKAIAEAKEKADELAGTLGVSLVRIVGFNEDGAQPIAFSAKDSVLGMGAAQAAPAPAALPQGQNKITSNVSITYEIR